MIIIKGSIFFSFSKEKSKRRLFHFRSLKKMIITENDGWNKKKMISKINQSYWCFVFFSWAKITNFFLYNVTYIMMFFKPSLRFFFFHFYKSQQKNFYPVLSYGSFKEFFLSLVRKKSVLNRQC